jgi:hypothetical protein
MQKKTKSLSISFAIIGIASLLVALLFSHSILLNNAISLAHIDSQVYIYTGLQLLKGKILYRDVFDHKGPVMYVFECLGLFFCKKNFTPLWLTQCLVFTLGICPLFIYWAKKYSASLSITAMFFMIAWFFRAKTIGDNLPEIYAISLLSLSYYFYVKILEKNWTNWWYTSLLGICSMSLFLLKPNFVVLIFPCICHLCYMLYYEKQLHKFLLNYALACLFMLLPFVCYFNYHHALQDALFAFWTFNISYIAQQKLSIWESIYEVFFKHPNYLLLFVVLVGIVKYWIAAADRTMLLMLCITLVLSAIILVGLPGRGAESLHYTIPFAPLIAWLVIVIGRDFQKFQSIILACIALYFCKQIAIHFFTAKKISTVVNTNIQYINRYKKPKETLCVLGNCSSSYLQTQLACNTAFSFTYPIMQNCSGTIEQKFLNQFENRKPNWILYESTYPFDSCMVSLLNGYQFIASDKNQQLYHLP